MDVLTRALSFQTAVFTTAGWQAEACAARRACFCNRHDAAQRQRIKKPRIAAGLL